ncbi:MAG: hypothetical protein QE271_12470 [Bacteriovoracaceae bacterium]|nr:hypothetical protein [Bacteriovoracaceae bacterium]
MLNYVSLIALSCLIFGISGNTFASTFLINQEVVVECLRQGNFQNLEFVKSFCQVKSQGGAKFISSTVETFDGDCSVTASVVDRQKVELVFIKNPNRFHRSSHLEVEEAKECLQTLMEEENNLF